VRCGHEAASTRGAQRGYRGSKGGTSCSYVQPCRAAGADRNLNAYLKFLTYERGQVMEILPQLCAKFEGGVWCGVVKLDADTTLCAAAVSPLACLLRRRSASVPRGEPGSRTKPAINTHSWRNQIAHIECRTRRPRVGQGEVLPWPQERSTSS